MSQPWRRQRLDTAAKELTAWLEQQRIQAIQTSSNCIISINASQAQLAAASDSSCGETDYLISATAQPTARASTSTAQMMWMNCCSPRAVLAPLRLRLRLPGESRQRCINITSPLGLIRLGQRSSDSDACNYTTAH